MVAIEEHWELLVGGPEADRSAPKVTMVMSPTSDLQCDYYIFNLNHWSYPEFAAVGEQVTVTVTMAYQDASWLPAPWFLGSTTLDASSVMRKEGFE